MKKIFLIGGGGHSLSCLDLLNECDDYTVVGVIDKNKNCKAANNGIPYLGGDENIKDFISERDACIIAIGQIKEAKLRKKLFNFVTEIKAKLPTIVAKSSSISFNSSIGNGSVIFHFCKINYGSVIMENCIVNTGAIIEHEAKVGAHTHISTGAILNGATKVGEETFIGSRAVVLEGREIGNRCIVQAGAIVSKNIPDDSVVLRETNI